MNTKAVSALTSVATPMVVNCVAYSRDGLDTRHITLDRIGEAIASSDTFVWAGLYEPDESLLSTLQQELDLPRLAIEDAHLAHQRTKIESYGDCLFIVAQTAQLLDGVVAFGETHIFLGKRYLITVRHRASLGYESARRTCVATPELLSLGPSFALFTVLDLIVDNYLPIVSEFQEELQTLEQDIFAETYKRDTIKRLYDMQRDLMRLRLGVTPLQEITNQLVRVHPHLIRDETRVYFRDVYDHVIQVNESTSVMRELLSAAINVSLSLVTVGQNEVMKKLAGWAAMLAAPTLITSWYGMNFRHMPELAGSWAYPVGIITLTGSLMGGIYIALKRARWL